jgi:hypothetical protein
MITADESAAEAAGKASHETQGGALRIHEDRLAMLDQRAAQRKASRPRTPSGVHTGQAVIYLLRYPNGKIYVGSKVGDDTGYWGSYDELTAERIQRDHAKLGLDPTPVKEILWRGAHDGDLLKREHQFIRQHRANDPDVGYNRMPMTRKNTPYKDVWVHDHVNHLCSTTHYPWGSYVLRCGHMPDGLCNRRGDRQPWGDAPTDPVCKIVWNDGREEDLPGPGNLWTRYLRHKRRMSMEWDRNRS